MKKINFAFLYHVRNRHSFFSKGYNSAKSDNLQRSHVPDAKHTLMKLPRAPGTLANHCAIQGKKKTKPTFPSHTLHEYFITVYEYVGLVFSQDFCN